MGGGEGVPQMPESLWVGVSWAPGSPWVGVRGSLRRLGPMGGCGGPPDTWVLVSSPPKTASLPAEQRAAAAAAQEAARADEAFAELDADGDGW